MWLVDTEWLLIWKYEELGLLLRRQQIHCVRISLRVTYIMYDSYACMCLDSMEGSYPET